MLHLQHLADHHPPGRRDRYRILPVGRNEEEKEEVALPKAALLHLSSNPCEHIIYQQREHAELLATATHVPTFKGPLGKWGAGHVQQVLPKQSAQSVPWAASNPKHNHLCNCIKQ